MNRDSWTDSVDLINNLKDLRIQERLSKIRKALKKYFVIEQEIRPILNYFHYFFVLEKKESQPTQTFSS